MIRNIIKFILVPSIAIVFFLGVFFGSGLSTHFHKYTFPGLLSDAQSAEPKGGFSSHAEFEQECGHCHAPLHCVTDTKCQDCHLEIAEQRATATGLHSRLPGIDQCETCHTEHLGRNASITEFAFKNIDHQLLAGFSLEKHGTNFVGEVMGCDGCHSQKKFAGDTLDCITCHVNEDHDYMAKHIDLYGATCIPCHDGSDSMAEFEHAHVYPLDGAHQDTDCQECHPSQTFASTPTDCASCHEEPELHIGIFGVKCDRCHVATAWVPAVLTEHTFLVDHGVDTISAEITCETCHIDTYTEYPCYSCHDSQEMLDYHAEIDIEEAYENCVECHPTGREDEADKFMQLESGL
jgi:hypothetical protein